MQMVNIYQVAVAGAEVLRAFEKCRKSQLAKPTRATSRALFWCETRKDHSAVTSLSAHSRRLSPANFFFFFFFLRALYFEESLCSLHQIDLIS